MNENTMIELENTLRKRNAELANELQPGLPEKRIRAVLGKAKVRGKLQALVQWYGWKNGIAHGRRATPFKRGFFPGRVYLPMELNYALCIFRFFKEAVEAMPGLAEAEDRFFPIMWDQLTKCVAIDLDSSCCNRAMLVDTSGEPHFREAYCSFEEFVTDLIRANSEDMPLKCFEQPDKWSEQRA